MSSGPLGGFPSGGSEGKNPPANAGDTGDSGSIPGSGRSPGVRAAHSSVPAWEIPCTEPGALHDVGQQRVRHN